MSNRTKVTIAIGGILLAAGLAGNIDKGSMTVTDESGKTQTVSMFAKECKANGGTLKAADDCEGGTLEQRMANTCGFSYHVQDGKLEQKCGELIDRVQADGHHEVLSKDGNFWVESK